MVLLAIYPWPRKALVPAGELLDAIGRHNQVLADERTIVPKAQTRTTTTRGTGRVLVADATDRTVTLAAEPRSILVKVVARP